MRVAVVHDWLTIYAGAERVLEQLLWIFPDADVFSVVDFLPNDQRSFIRDKRITTSFIQKLPFAQTKYRQYLPLMPLAIEQFDLSAYDLVISNSYAVAKGVLTGPDQLHVCLCCSPMRYAWDLQHEYLVESGLNKGLKSWPVRWLLHRLRLWDMRTANQVDGFIAVSHFIARRIRKIYRRAATVIYPPVDVRTFTLHTRKEDFYLVVSRLVPYKKIDVIVEAFSGMPHKKLVVIGAGPDKKKVCSKARANIRILGYQPVEIVRDYMQRARAFVFMAEEDFGIAPVEAQACGTPVIAYGKGGLTETIIPGETGLLFPAQSCESLRQAVSAFEAGGCAFDPERIRKNAEHFSAERFRQEFAKQVEQEWTQFHKDRDTKPLWAQVKRRELSI